MMMKRTLTARNNKKPDKSADVKALEILSYRARSEAELKAKLAGYGYGEAEIEGAVRYVKSYGYINDEAYAEQFVASRCRDKGRSYLRRELKSRGVSDEYIENALEGIEDDEQGTAYALLVKKAGEPHRLLEKEKARLYRFLAGRGFSPSSAYGAIKQFEQNDKGNELCVE